MKRRILRSFTRSEESLDTFKVHNLKLDSDFLSRLRVMFLTLDDLKSNPSISSFTEQDFKTPISDINEGIVQEVLCKLISNYVTKDSQKRKQILSSANFSKSEERLINVIKNDAFSFESIHKIDPILGDLNDYQRARVRNFLVSEFDLEMLQKNLVFMQGRIY